jgi:Putative porin
VSLRIYLTNFNLAGQTLERVFLAAILSVFLISGEDALAQQSSPGKADTLTQPNTNTNTNTKTKSKKRPIVAKPQRKGSKVVDDSSRNVYGPRTVLQTTEKSIFYNRNIYTQLDTSYHNMHRWTFVQQSNYKYKDLGNVGTALSSIFPLVSPTIGVSSGFNSYAPYYETAEPKYFDTKSPYTMIYLVWGGNGRAISRIEFSRNVNSRWNFGFDYRPILVDKQIQHAKSARQTVSHYYDIYTTYKSKNDKYKLLLNYRRIRHRVFENGGVALMDTIPNYLIKFYDPNAPVNLLFQASVTEDSRAGVHFFQQYQITKPLQVYTISDVATQTNKFNDKTSTETGLHTPTAPFDFFQGDSTVASDRAILRTIQNEAGVKGTAGPLFYDFYFKLRAYQYEDSYQQKGKSILAYQKSGTERYVGGRVALKFDSLTEVSGNAEYLLDGHYKIEADWASPWLDASLRSTLARPGFMQNIYKGSHNQWSNSFTNVASQQISGFIKANLGPIFISPGATFTTLTNYVYFKEVKDPTVYQSVLPYQNAGNQIIFSPEVRLTIRVLRKIYLRTQATYTSVALNSGNAIQIPTTFVNSQLSYEGPFFKGNLHVQVGADIHWQSTYNALGYATAIQSFYVQDIDHAKPSPSFLIADLFLNAKIKRGRFFFKYLNLVQAFTKQGYMPTPNYPGQKNVLDFGFIMLLFD